MVELLIGTGVTLPITVIIQAELKARLKWEDAFRVLLRGLFPTNILATHSCLGARSDRPPLDNRKVETLKGKRKILWSCLNSFKNRRQPTLLNVNVNNQYSCKILSPVQSF